MKKTSVIYEFDESDGQVINKILVSEKNNSRSDNTIVSLHAMV